MKYFKYTQYLYLIASLLFLISVIDKAIKKQDFNLQAIIAVGFAIMFFVRRSFVKKMENNKKNL
jgi:ABC-type transport system involved in cytochrome bd biosynthesis fused ATPase/permease subunit